MFAALERDSEYPGGCVEEDLMLSKLALTTLRRDLEAKLTRAVGKDTVSAFTHVPLAYGIDTVLVGCFEPEWLAEFMNPIKRRLE